MNRRLTMAGAVGLAALLALGACGRKGDLEPPPGMSPDMAAKSSGCETKQGSEIPQDQRPIDAGGLTNPSGNTNRMPDMTEPPC